MRRTILSASAALAWAGLPAAAEVPKVVTDIPPVHSLVAQVMGDLGAPTVLLEQGANAHNYQLRPSQARALADANLVFWIGPEMTPWLDRALEGAEVPSVTLMEQEGTITREFASMAEEDEAGHDAHADHAHDDHAHDDHGGEASAKEADAHDDHGHEGHAHDEHAHEGHSHEGLDPHAWLDPANARLWVGVIAEELAAADPTNAATYRANAAAAATRIAATDTEAAALLSVAKGQPIIVYHEALGYFAAHYGLDVRYSVALGDAAEPGAARLSEVREAMADVACVFPEAQHDPKLIETLVDGTSTRLGKALDPEGRDLVPGPELYDAMILGLATTIAECLTGA